MANPKHLEKLELGRESWNDWRQSNPQIMPDLSSSHLSRKDFVLFNFNGVNLSGAELLYANLEGTQFRGANLENATLRYSMIEAANFTDANLVGANLERTYGEDAIFDKAN